MQLVIVESPTKARKLSEYLGKEFKVKASVGHVRDLPSNTLGVEIDKNFEPTYVINPEKMDVVKELESLAKSAKGIILATDPDREGEAIAWHIKHILDPKEQNGKLFVRATFHEITKQAVLDAIAHPSTLNTNLVDAQQARRVVDRLVGYQVSPVLWKKIRRGLSAGRVQSVALRLIVEREREIEAFKPEEYWELDVLLATDLNHSARWQAPTKLNEVQKPDWIDQPEAGRLIGRVAEVQGKAFNPVSEADVAPVVVVLPQAEFTVIAVDKKERRRASLPPFTTSTLQQAAATRLGFTSKQTMSIAQQLYEEGLITYHRTDSVNLSEQSIAMARDHIELAYGKEYVPAQPRRFSVTSKNAQEAHEAVRITDIKLRGDDIAHKSKKFSPRHEKLYDLIWRRFVASQMAEATYSQTALGIKYEHGSSHGVLKANGSILKFDGWMKLFPGSGDVIIPEVSQGQKVAFSDLFPAQKFTQPPPRYNDASLVKELEKRGIGRPSTYASIISVIEDRGYVERMDKRFVATAIGMTVNDFLVMHFPVIMDYDFTAEMEEDLDRISRGEKEWRKIVKTFYTPLAKIIETVSEKAERTQIPVEKTGEKCPTCGDTDHGEIVIRSGRFGKFKSCSRFPECKFTENIVEKVDGVKCPLCGEGDVIARNSRWGKQFFGCSRYPACEWANWQKPEPGMKISAKEWEMLKQQRAERAAKRQAKFGKKDGQTTKAATAKTGSKKSGTKKAAKSTTSKKTTKKKTGGNAT